MWRYVYLVISVIGTLATWFTRGTIEAWFFEKVLRMSVPSALSLEYFLPAGFALLTLWLFAKLLSQKRGTTPPIDNQGGAYAGRDNLGSQNVVNNASVTFNPSPPPPPPTNTGILGAGSNIQGALVEGFDVGINAPGANIINPTVRRTQSTGGDFHTDGRFARHSHRQLAAEAKIASQMLMGLRAAHARRLADNPAKISEAFSWRQHEFEAKHLENAREICAEILKRTGRVEIDRDLPARYGGDVILSGNAAGYEPIQHAAVFIDHIAKGLPE